MKDEYITDEVTYDKKEKLSDKISHLEDYQLIKQKYVDDNKLLDKIEELQKEIGKQNDKIADIEFNISTLEWVLDNKQDKEGY